MEPGDFDGDGRLSLADLHQPLSVYAADTAALQAFLDYPCIDSSRLEPGHQFPFPHNEVRSMILLEIVRRAVPDALPHWDRIHRLLFL